MADGVDKKQRLHVDKIGSHVSESPLVTHAVAAPAPEHDGIKDAARLKQLMQHHGKVMLAWLDPMQQKLALLAATPAKTLGFGPWRKKHPDEDALCGALEAHIKPVFEKLWGVALGEPPPLPGEPPLHFAYEADLPFYEFQLQHEETKNVAHAYAMTLAHTYFRMQLAALREEQTVKIPEDLLYVLEANVCQYYVPHTLAAYFEAQPLRALMREIANRFRKVAFGGQ